MGLQDEIEIFITDQFDKYRLYDDGKNWLDAYEAAQKVNSLDQWAFNEVSKGAIAGAAEMAIPGLGIPLAVAGISYLLYQMAKVGWGIGALQGAMISETEGASDLGNILSLWGKDSSISPAFLALSTGVVTEYISNEDFQNRVFGFIEENSSADDSSSDESTGKLSTDQLILNSIVLLPIVAGMITKTPRSARLVGTVGVSATMSIGTKMARKQLSKQMGKRVGRGIGKRVATTVATRLATRAGSRVVLTWIPVVGAAANGALNLTTLQSMKNSALEYYEKKLTIEDVNNAI
ncbi:MAG: hypothetical protein DHS20C20_03740 [Ardenticatenaceae bacterium]|nr:MAG: hypothetical protein DHS20C20_03740 [Ardenticatenaceae bacterium]